MLNTSRSRLRAVALAGMGFIILTYEPLAAEEPADKSLVWSGSVGVVSNYVARGLSQSWGKPAIQTEIEANHESGGYFGAFTSSISRNLYPRGNVEIDVWAGYEYELWEDMTLRMEGIFYVFPGANVRKATCGIAIPCPSQSHSFNTTQTRIGATWYGITLRLDYALTDYFGESQQTGFARGTRGTWYWELNTEHELPRVEGWALISHIGFTRFPAKHAIPDGGITQNPNYWDWHLGVIKEFKGRLAGWQGSVTVTGTSHRSFRRSPSLINESIRDLGKPALVLGIDRLF